MSREREVVRVSTEVPAPPDRAFALFTEEIDAWWLRAPRYWGADDRRVYFEPGPDGRLLVERSGGPPFEMGRVLEWRPGERLVLQWRERDLDPGLWTTLELRFEPTARGTRVSLEHRGLEQLAPDHPARQGLVGPAFRDLRAVRWADLLVSLQRLAEERRQRPPPGGPDGQGC